MKCLAVPDIHENVKFLRAVDSLVREREPEKIIVLGDLFNKKKTYKYEASLEETIEWVNSKLTDPRYHFLLGNHDLQYLSKRGQPQKQEVIMKNLNSSFWSMANFTAVYGKWIFSHAGLTPKTISFIDDASKAKKICKERGNHPLLWRGPSQGGTDLIGGPCWLDFRTEFLPIKFVNQIVGHSSSSDVQEKHSKNSMNYCLDANGSLVGMVDKTSTQLTVIKTH